MSALSPAELGLPAEPAAAKPKDPPATHLRVKLDAQLRALLGHEAGARVGSDPEHVHQMRVAIRRMRSVLKMSGDLLGPTTEPVRAELGWLGTTLGEVRDLDVLIIRLRAVTAGFGAVDQPSARRLVSKFVTQRGNAKRRLIRTLDSSRYATLINQLAQLARRPEIERVDGLTGDGATTARLDLVAGLRKPYRKLAKAVAALPEDPPDDDLHALRIMGKRLRYAAELAEPAAGKKRAPQVRELMKAAKRLQTVLGEHQDACVAAERVRRLLDPDTSPDPQVAFIAGRIVECEAARRADARADYPRAVARIHSTAKSLLR
ncbi:CHAD domain-containing protein [Amycolatopsis suaedae]|uniref:CHAD domain-containing protein n=1 Tax=Amycolatopsis suaedae TaxID=2510978 RepID=A0A4Q7J750_9PSEU|nr:CHAD domain-containing protein [Amycolatopsis suaedae]RZQ62696.1 CHAD domain-containing protein [Amycolatopsis suaedae]